MRSESVSSTEPFIGRLPRASPSEKKKAPCEDGALSCSGKEPSGPFRFERSGLDRHGRLALRAVLGVLHLSGLRREERVILADADVGAGMERRPALANQDRAGVHLLAAVCLEAEALRLGIAAVAGRPACFLVCHECILELRRSRPHGFPCSS